MGEKDAVKQGVQIMAMQLQIWRPELLGKSVSVDMQIETWAQGEKVLRKIRSQYILKAIALDKVYTSWLDCIFVLTCFSLYLNSCHLWAKSWETMPQLSHLFIKKAI